MYSLTDLKIPTKRNDSFQSEIDRLSCKTINGNDLVPTREDIAENCKSNFRALKKLNPKPLTKYMDALLKEVKNQKFKEIFQVVYYNHILFESMDELIAKAYLEQCIAGQIVRKVVPQ